MNRIRVINNNKFQVLLTPNIQVSPDSALMIGGWTDPDLHNYSVLEFNNFNSALCEALQHPDIDWYRLVVNHKHIYIRLRNLIQFIIKKYNFTAEFIPKLQDPESFKNSMFSQVMNYKSTFSIKNNLNSIISFTIVNPYFYNLQLISQALELFKEHYNRDDLRIRDKKVIDNKIIILQGVTEQGTLYDIRLMPSLLYQYSAWLSRNLDKSEEIINKTYQDTLKQQDVLDRRVLK